MDHGSTPLLIPGNLVPAILPACHLAGLQIVIVAKQRRRVHDVDPVPRHAAEPRAAPADADPSRALLLVCGAQAPARAAARRPAHSGPRRRRRRVLAHGELLVDRRAGGAARAAARLRAVGAGRAGLVEDGALKGRQDAGDLAQDRSAAGEGYDHDGGGVFACRPYIYQQNGQSRR